MTSRFRRSEAAPNGFEAEWRVANRNFAIPEVCCLRNCVARVATYFAAPRQVITLTSEAESWHLSYQGAMNVQSHVVRDTGVIQAGARFGAAPWQVGFLAALLLVFEILVGARSPAALEGRALQVTPGHLQRAYALLQLAPWPNYIEYPERHLFPSSLTYCRRPGAASEAHCPWRCSSQPRPTAAAGRRPCG